MGDICSATFTPQIFVILLSPSQSAIILTIILTIIPFPSPFSSPPDAGIELKIDDFNRVGSGWGSGERGGVPLLSNMSPHGRFHMSDLDSIGGVPVVMKVSNAMQRIKSNQRTDRRSKSTD